MLPVAGKYLIKLVLTLFLKIESRMIKMFVLNTWLTSLNSSKLTNYKLSQLILFLELGRKYTLEIKTQFQVASFKV